MFADCKGSRRGEKMGIEGRVGRIWKWRQGQVRMTMAMVMVMVFLSI